MTADSRPKVLTAEMALRAALATAHDLAKSQLIEQSEVEDCAADIAKCAWHHHMDGYQLAKRLDDRCHWSCDLDMAEALDAFPSYAHDEIKAAQTAWAERTKQAPPFPSGTRVRTRWGDGEITGVCGYMPASFLVAMDKDRDAENKTTRSIVPFEDAEALA